MARDPLAFLDDESPQRKTLLLLLALIRKQGGEVELTLDDLTAIEDGASYHKYPGDKGTSIVLRYARKGAEATFLTALGDQSSTTPKYRTKPTIPPPAVDLTSPTSSRHAIHDDVDLALREEEMAQRASNVQKERLRQARAEAGVMPWRTVPTRQ